jgi:hypothetical protein
MDFVINSNLVILINTEPVVKFDVLKPKNSAVQTSDTSYQHESVQNKNEQRRSPC